MGRTGFDPVIVIGLFSLLGATPVLVGGLAVGAVIAPGSVIGPAFAVLTLL